MPSLIHRSQIYVYFSPCTGKTPSFKKNTSGLKIIKRLSCEWWCTLFKWKITGRIKFKDQLLWHLSTKPSDKFVLSCDIWTHYNKMCKNNNYLNLKYDHCSFVHVCPAGLLLSGSRVFLVPKRQRIRNMFHFNVICIIYKVSKIKNPFSQRQSPFAGRLDFFALTICSWNGLNGINVLQS